MDTVVQLGFVTLTVAAIWWAWNSRAAAANDDESICSHCGYDLRASSGRCPECGMPFTRAGDHIPLRDDWPADAISPRIPKADEVPVCIHTTNREWEARTLREQFEVRGIPAQVQEPTALPVNPYIHLAPRNTGSWRVTIWSGDAELAASIRDKLIPHQPPPSDG